MKKSLIILLSAATIAIGIHQTVQAGWPVTGRKAACVGQSLPWHNKYAHQAYGEPVALVVPPTAEYQTHYGWGVAATRNTPIFHQYGAQYPGAGGFGGYNFRHPPYWPSDTNDLGVYYIRGPW